MIYFIQNTTDQLIKIGYAKTSVNDRMKTLQCGNPSKLVLLLAMDGDLHYEAACHKLFKSLRVRGEWFRPGKKLMDRIDELRKSVTLDFPPGVEEGWN